MVRDESLADWGASLGVLRSDHWIEDEKLSLIYILKLKVITFSLKTVFSNVTDASIRIGSCHVHCSADGSFFLPFKEGSCHK